MRPLVVDGKHIAQEIIENLKKPPKPEGFVAIFTKEGDVVSQSFVKQKEKVAQELEIELRHYNVSETDTNDSLRKRVAIIAQKKRCKGVIIQLPLPAACNISYIANTIPPEKDLDCLGARNLGSLYQGGKRLIPPAVRVLEHILQTHNRTLTSFKSIAIIGQGNLVGKPIAAWCVGKHNTIHICDKGFNIKDLKQSDLIILGAGYAGVVTGEHITSGSWVIDFGYSKNNGKLTGDFDVTAASVDHVELYTPTPGGTGPILVASLFENMYL